MDSLKQAELMTTTANRNVDPYPNLALNYQSKSI